MPSSQSKQFLQTHSIRDAHPTDIFALAVTPSQLLSAAGSSSLAARLIANGATSDERTEPYPLVWTVTDAHPLGCHHLCASLDGKKLASAGFAGEVKIWKPFENEQSGQHEWKEHARLGDDALKAGEHWALSLNEDGRFLAATTHDGRILVYDTQSSTIDATRCIARYETKGSFGMAVDISADGEMTASGHQNGGIFIFNNSTRRLVQSLSGLVKAVRVVKFSPACRYLAAAGDAKIIALYDTSSGEQIATFNGHSSWIMSLDWNWSGEYLLSGAYDGKIKVWSIERRECVATQSDSDDCIWTVKWLVKASMLKNETFVTAGANRAISFYREASGT